MLVVSLNTLPYHMLAQFHADETVRTGFLLLSKKILALYFSIKIKMVQNVVSVLIVRY